VNPAVPTLCKALHAQTDLEVLTDATWALSYLLRGGGDSASDYIQNIEVAVNVSNVVPDLVSILAYEGRSILVPCLRTLGNICCGEEHHLNAVVEHPDFLKSVFNLLDSVRKSVRRENIWVLSNIVAGAQNQISRIFQSFPFVEKLISCIQNDANEIKTEALFVFSNIFRHENISDFLTLWNAKVLDCYIMMLRNPIDTLTTRVNVEGIYHMLKVGRKLAIENNREENMVLVELEKAGVLDYFDILQDHDEVDVQITVRKVILEFMPFIKIKPFIGDSDYDDDEDEDDDVSEDDNN